jgi:carbon-monoxide dehydrogenase large subunit
MGAFPSGAHVGGKVYNHVLVEAQLHGGLVQGIGQILGEHCAYDRRRSHCTTARFPRRAIRLAQRVPVKGTTGAVPSIANAGMDALAPLRIHKLDLPYTGSL